MLSPEGQVGTIEWISGGQEIPSGLPRASLPDQVEVQWLEDSAGHQSESASSPGDALERFRTYAG